MQEGARDTGPLQGGSDWRPVLAFARKGPRTTLCPAAGAAISQREQIQTSVAAAAQVALDLVLSSDALGTHSTGTRRIQRWFCVLTPSSSRSHKQLGTAYSTGCPLTRLPKRITAFEPPSSAPYLPHQHPGAEKRVSVSNPWRAPSSRWAGRGKTVAPKRHSTTSTNWAAPSLPCSSSPRVTLPLPPLPLCLEAKF